MRNRASDERLASWISLAHCRPAPRRFQRPASVHPIEDEPQPIVEAERILRDSEVPVGIKRQSTLAVMSEPHIESELVQMCRQAKWREVLERCASNPEEAIPVPKVRRFKRSSTSLLFASDDEEISVFEDTALGIVCAATSTNLSSAEQLELVRVLCKACPNQVRASQTIPGHTPLRDALRNNKCTPNVLEVLLSTDMMVCSPVVGIQAAAHMTDQDGLYPIDHIILGVHTGQSPKRQFGLLKQYVTCLQVPDHSSHTVNPIIRLLSLGAAPESEKKRCQSKNDEDTSLPPGDCFLESVKLLLDSEPALISMRSKATGCTPLHVGLRNYGQNELLIKELVQRDIEKNTFALRNIYGDLPLHVACTVGVPLDILKIILEGTIVSTEGDQEVDSVWAPHPLVWSKNQSGYTPVDLEWVRHIESGKGIYAKRSFYPLEASGILKHCRKQDEFYKGLLRDAVDKVIHQTGNTDEEEATTEVESSRFGALIDRIALIVQYAAQRNPQIPSTYLLHSASILSRPTGSALPRPILELFLWLYPEQVSQPDENGNLPLHYALSLASDHYPENKYLDQLEWAHWVQLLLKACPKATKQYNHKGRLPLHIALDSSLSSDRDFSIFVQVQSKPTLSDSLLESLTIPFPEAIDIPDPSTGLYPFMMAAACDNVSLASTFALLRCSPARCNDAYQQC